MYSQLAYEYARKLVYGRSIPVRIKLLAFEEEVVALLVSVRQKDFLKRGNAQVGHSQGSKGYVVVDDLRLTAHHAMADHGLGDLLHIRNALAVDLKDALKNVSDGRLMG